MACYRMNFTCFNEVYLLSFKHISLVVIRNTRVLPVHVHRIAMTTITFANYHKLKGSCLINVTYNLSIAHTVYFLLFPPAWVLLSSPAFPTYVSSFKRKYLSFCVEWHFWPEVKRDYRCPPRSPLLQGSNPEDGIGRLSRNVGKKL